MSFKYISPRYYQQHIPADPWWSRLLRWALGPVGLIGIISLLVLLVNFYFAYHIRGYDSDDVIWQNALLYWKPFQHMTYYSDAGASYVDRIPLYWLVGKILSPGRHALFADGAILTVGNFILVYWSAVYFLKKAGLQLTYWTLTPFLWLSSFGYAVTQLFVETSMHNIEIGVIFAACMLVAKIYYGEFRPLASWRTMAFTILCSLLLGYTIVGDRYVMYYGLLPILAYAAVGFVFQQRPVIRKRIGLLFGVIILSVVFAGAIQLVLSKAGVDFQAGVGARTPQFVAYTSIYANLGATIYDLFIIFGANFWGRNVISVVTIGALINTAFLFLIVYAIKNHLRSGATGRPKVTDSIPLRLMAILFLWGALIFTVSSIGGASGSYHYLVILPFIGAVLLAGYMATTHGVVLQVMAALVLIVSVVNIGTNYQNAKIPSTISGGFFLGFDQANGRDYSIMYALKAHGLTKGYASYWNANVTSYLSGGKVDTIPSLCNIEGKSVTYKWLMTSSQLTRPASRTFFLVDPSNQNVAPPNCPGNAVKKQFGPPAQVFTDTGTTVYVYDRNITIPYGSR